MESWSGEKERTQEKRLRWGGLLDCLKDTAFREGRLDVSAAVAVD